MGRNDDDYVSEDEDRPRSPAKKSRRKQDFTFEGTAGTYFVVWLLSTLLTMVTFGLGASWAICMQVKWTVENLKVDGRNLRFTGTGGEMLILWLKWLLLCIVTLGIYSIWVTPELYRWIADHTEFDD